MTLRRNQPIPQRKEVTAQTQPLILRVLALQPAALEATPLAPVSPQIREHVPLEPGKVEEELVD